MGLYRSQDYSDEKYKLKKCMLIHDLSGYGKCSLSAAIPILNASCVQTVSIPTAFFSNHTAFPVYYSHDLTSDMLPTADKWQQLNLGVDAVYTGFLGSLDQINIVSEIIDRFTSKDREKKIIFVDPVMGDNGVLYKTYTKEMASEVEKLCRKADIISPNMTEAARLLGIEYKDGPYTYEFIEEILKGLLTLGVKYAVLTGVRFDDDNIGAAIMGGDEVLHFSLSKRYKGFFQGTGDVFASAMLGQLLAGRSAEDAINVAVNFTGKSIENTIKSGYDPLEGVIFEPELKYLNTFG